MPVLSWAHSQYWAGTEEPPITLGASRGNAYVPWQTSVIVGGGFGVTQVIWEWAVDRIAEKVKAHGDTR